MNDLSNRSAGHFSIPSSWAWVRLTDLQPEFQNGLASRGDPSGSPTVVLRLADITNGRISLASTRSLPVTNRSKSKYAATDADILVIRVNGSTDLVGRFISCDVSELVYCDHFIRMHVRSDIISQRFLTLLGSSWFVRQQFERLFVSTAGQKTVNQGHIASILLPLPPRAEQDRIVAAIEEQFSRLDAGVGALERVRLNQNRIRAAVLQAAVSGQLVHQNLSEGTGTGFLAMVAQRRGETRSSVAAASADLSVPETWTVASLEAVTDPHRVICYGILMPKVREGGTVPYVEVKDLRARRLDVAALHRTSAELHKEFSRSQLNAGDVVLAIRGSYDRALVVPANVAGANVSRDVARIAPLPGINASFVAAYLMSPPGLQYLRQRARGVAVKGVNIADLRSMPIPVPPQDEQNRIVRELDRIDSIIGDLETVLISQRARAATLRSSILTAAFSGNLLPQDPRDEPASVLLEQIAMERVATDGKNRARSRKPVHPRKGSRHE